MSVTNEKWRDAASKIGGRVGAQITGALERNEVLKTLNLRDNKIGSEGAAAIAEALRGNAVLKTLVLRSNNLGDEGESDSRCGERARRVRARDVSVS